MDNRLMSAMEALQGGDEKIHALLDAFPLMIWTAGPNGEVDYVNGPFYQYTGWQPGKAPGKEWLSVIHEDDHSLSLERWNNSLQTGTPYEVEYRIRRALDDVYIWHMVRAVPLKDKQGAVLRWLGSSVDIHYLKMTEEQLSRFAYMATHDLKGPVNNLKSLIELFKIQQKEDWEQLFEFLEISTAKLDETLHNLVNKVKMPVQQEAGQYVNLAALLRNVLESKGLQKDLDRIGGEIVADFSQYPAIGYIRSVLQLIFHTMISNAIQYRDQGRKLEIKIESSKIEDFVVLRFEDNGSGIDLRQYGDLLFSPFAQFHEDKSGKGMGLYLVKNMITKHGGWIEPESRPGEGTSFKLYLKECPV